MKLKYIFLLVSLFLAGCSKSEDPIVDDNPIKLSSYSVRILAGDDCMIDVYSDTENLSLIEQNPEIATGWWSNNGKSVRIKGESVGVTSILIKDRYNPNIFSKIEIVSDYFEGNYKEVENNAIIVVQTDDKAVKEEIESELRVLAKDRIGTFYSFSKDTKTLIIKEPQGRSYFGSYDWDIDSITIKMNETNQKYLFRKVDDGLVELGLDLIEVYRLKYPNTSIYHVELSVSLLAC